MSGPRTTASADLRRAAGRARRKAVPRSSHGDWEPSADRPDPLDLLADSNADRVPVLVPIRHRRMLESSFAYLRGTPVVMAHDLASTPTTGLRVQACGDCHLGNFGSYATPERRLVFDLNDFDETLPGPFEWDVKRLAVSAVLAARVAGLDDVAGVESAIGAVGAYREAMDGYAGSRVLDVWYDHVDLEDTLRSVPAAQRIRLERNVAKARRRTSLQALPKLTELVGDRRRIAAAPPLVLRIDDHPDIERSARDLFVTYRESIAPERRVLLERFRLADLAFKVVGVGSVGTRCLVALAFGRGDDDPLFLQIKEAQLSVLAPHAGPSEYEHQGERVVQGQRLMQFASDAFLGWGTAAGRHYYVRQLRDMKGSFDLANATPKTLRRYAAVCGRVLARAHARSGDAATIAGYLGRSDAFDRAIGAFAMAYAAQVERDHRAFQQAVADGRVEVAPSA